MVSWTMLLILCYCTENLVFLHFAIFKKYPIVETLWQEQEERKKVSFAAESVEKGFVLVFFFFFYYYYYYYLFFPF